MASVIRAIVAIIPRVRDIQRFFPVMSGAKIPTTSEANVILAPSRKKLDSILKPFLASIVFIILSGRVMSSGVQCGVMGTDDAKVFDGLYGELNVEEGVLGLLWRLLQFEFCVMYRITAK